MGRFARDAPWIRRIFAPSGTPATRQPFQVSEDVQLTQDYLAHGQTQKPALFVYSDSVTNPGQNGSRSIINPHSSTPDLPIETWRVFFASLQIAATPVSGFDFTVRLRYGPAANAVVISEVMRISNTESQPKNVWPATAVDCAEVAALPENFHLNPAPVLLQSSPDLDQVTVLEIFQVSAQAVGTETILVEAYILRNPIGIAHVL